MTPPIPGELRPAYGECQKQALTHYENFPVASLLLPKESRPHVAALYAFARTADDFADEPPSFFVGKGRAKSPEVLTKGDEGSIRKWRLRQIGLWEKQLNAAVKGKKAPAVLRAFAHTLKTFQIPLSLPLDLLRAFRMDAVLHRYSTWNSLLYYCRHSANPVGRMVLYISGIRDPKLHGYSDFICSGLQLINFWQDSAIDLKKGRIYYPQSELMSARVTQKQLLRLQETPAIRNLVKNAVDYTENYFRRGYPLLERVGGRLKLELRATYLGGQGILNKIRAMDYNVLQSRPSWSTSDKLFLGLKALLGPVHP
jgi:squalene synthase HpnC